MCQSVTQVKIFLMQFGVLQEYPIFADAKMVVPGGSDSPEAEKIHIAPVRVMPTLGILVTIIFLHARYPDPAPSGIKTFCYEERTVR